MDIVNSLLGAVFGAAVASLLFYIWENRKLVANT